MKFDHIIMNPPYSKSLHLEILERSIDSLDENHGTLSIIEPATWLINIRKNGKSKLYDRIKSKLKNHVQSVLIENYNKEFNTRLPTPFSITKIDFSKQYSCFEFKCFGYKQIVNSLYDCNLIGNYNTIWSIFNKILSCKDMMFNHTTSEKLDSDSIKYLPRPRILPWHQTMNEFKQLPVGNVHVKRFICPCISDIRDNIVDYVPLNKAHNKYKCVYGTEKELNNFKHFVYYNKLPAFICMCIIIDLENMITNYIPWVVDREYTDDEIYNKFNFTEEEIQFIDRVIKKHSANSLWYKRAMLGSNTASDEEVQSYMENL
jgi:hypothetical protein